jgi:hypothetical protein
MLMLAEHWESSLNPRCGFMNPPCQDSSSSRAIIWIAPKIIELRTQHKHGRNYHGRVCHLFRNSQLLAPQTDQLLLLRQRCEPSSLLAEGVLLHGMMEIFAFISFHLMRPTPVWYVHVAVRLTHLGSKAHCVLFLSWLVLSACTSQAALLWLLAQTCKPSPKAYPKA